MINSDKSFIVLGIFFVFICIFAGCFYGISQVTTYYVKYSNSYIYFGKDLDLCFEVAQKLNLKCED